MPITATHAMDMARWGEARVGSALRTPKTVRIEFRNAVQCGTLGGVLCSRFHVHSSCLSSTITTHRLQALVAPNRLGWSAAMDLSGLSCGLSCESVLRWLPDEKASAFEYWIARLSCPQSGDVKLLIRGARNEASGFGAVRKPELTRHSCLLSVDFTSLLPGCIRAGATQMLCAGATPMRSIHATSAATFWSGSQWLDVSHVRLIPRGANGAAVSAEARDLRCILRASFVACLRESVHDRRAVLWPRDRPLVERRDGHQRRRRQRGG